MKKCAFILIYFIPPQLANKNTSIALLSTVQELHVGYMCTYTCLPLTSKAKFHFMFIRSCFLSTNVLFELKMFALLQYIQDLCVLLEQCNLLMNMQCTYEECICCNIYMLLHFLGCFLY